MPGQGQKVRCSKCGKEFNLSKRAKDGDLINCPYCETELEVIKKRRKLDVVIPDALEAVEEIEMDLEYEEF